MKRLKKAVVFVLAAAMLAGGQKLVTYAGVTLRWPVPGHTALSQGYHDGKAIDISDGSINGATVCAALGGTVSNIWLCGNTHYNAGDCNGFGTGLVIRGDDGRYYQYAHMQAGSIPANVHYGARVEMGQQIGRVGTTGWSTGPHLHFGISLGKYYNESGINPQNETYIYSDAVPPSNPQIALGQNWFDLADNVYVRVSANGAVNYYGAMYKDGARIWEGHITNGILEFPATQFGVGEYSIYASCSNSSGSVDTPWANFSVVAGAGYSDVSVSKRHYNLEDTVSISVSTVCAHGQVIGINKEGVGRIYTGDTASPYTIGASSLGKGSYSAYFSVYNHYGGVDTRAIQFEVDQHTYRLIEETEAGNERYECSVCEEDINIDFSKEEYVITEGSSIKIPVIITPEVSEIDWVSSDSSIVSISNDGKLEGIKTGECTVTAKIENIEKTYRITVKKKNFAEPEIHSISAEKAYVSKDGGKVVITVRGTSLPEDLNYSIDSIKVMNESMAVNPTRVKTVGTLLERTFEITLPATSGYKETLQWRVKVSTIPQISGEWASVTQLISIEGDAVAEGTKIALRGVIEEKKEFQEGDYTAGSWAAYTTAIKKAADLLADKAAIATDTACQCVLQEVKEARENLIRTLAPDDGSKLSSELEKVSKLNKADYTADSWKAYETAIEEARKLIMDKEATDAACQAAIKKIEAAKKALVIRKKEPVKVKKISINTLALSDKIASGKSVQLTANVVPGNAANKTVRWEVSNERYASVNQNGKVTVKKAGGGKTVTIIATAVDGSGERAVYKLKIMKHAVVKIQLKAKKTVKAGKKLTIKPIVKTTGKKANKKLVWTSSNPKYAAVNSKGVVKTRKEGKNKSVRITAEATDGSNRKAVITIRIK